MPILYVKRIISLFLLGLIISCASIEQLKPSEFTAPEGAITKKNVQIVMRDGIRLNTLLIVPKQANEGPVPTILTRTPYKTEMNSWKNIYRNLLEQGYAIVMQHERGRYFSEGQFKLLGGALNDGWDTLDWIADQPWSNGAIGTYGCSSSAENQLKLAAASHPAHKAMVVGSAGVGIAEAGQFKEQGNFWRGGVWQQGWNNFFVGSGLQHWPQLPPHLTSEQRQNIIPFFDLDINYGTIQASDFNNARMHLPMIEIATELNAPKNEVNQYLMAGPADPGWSINRVSQGEQITVPMLWFESLYDISARSSLAYFEWNRQANSEQQKASQRMHLSQGGHCSFNSDEAHKKNSKIGELELGDMRFDYDQLVIDWFNRWLKQQPVKANENLAYTTYLGQGEWLETDQLPLQGNQVWYLTSAQGLATESDSTVRKYSYDYDPGNPVPSLGGEIYGEGDDHRDGSFDQRPLQLRDDVLVFTSEPMISDLTLFGMVEVVLTVSSDKPDTDFTVKINDVYPDGRAFNLGNTILRMRYREGLGKTVFMQAGETYQIELPPIMLSRIIKKGHKLQVEVSSSNFPSYARNLNTRADPYTSTEVAIANNQLHVGGANKTFIKLSVKPD